MRRSQSFTFSDVNKHCVRSGEPQLQTATYPLSVWIYTDYSRPSQSKDFVVSVWSTANGIFKLQRIQSRRRPTISQISRRARHGGDLPESSRSRGRTREKFWWRSFAPFCLGNCTKVARTASPPKQMQPQAQQHAHREALRTTSGPELREGLASGDWHLAGQQGQWMVQDRTSRKVISKVGMLDASVPLDRADGQEIGAVDQMSSAVVLAVWSETMDAQVDDTVHLSGC